MAAVSSPCRPHRVVARRLEGFPEGRSGAGRPSTYPWHERTDGSFWEIRRGEDYEIPTQNMQVSLHMRAQLQGKKVVTRSANDADGERIVFQFRGDNH